MFRYCHIFLAYCYLHSFLVQTNTWYWQNSVQNSAYLQMVNYSWRVHKVEKRTETHAKLFETSFENSFCHRIGQPQSNQTPILNLPVSFNQREQSNRKTINRSRFNVSESIINECAECTPYGIQCIYQWLIRHISCCPNLNAFGRWWIAI